MLYHALIVFKLILAIVIDDIPADVQIQIDRQNFTEDKLIKQQIDDVIEVDEDVSWLVSRSRSIWITTPWHVIHTSIDNAYPVILSD